MPADAAGLVAERLSRLPWPEGSLPVHVAGGLPLAGTAAGARTLAVIRALRAHLSGEALVTVLPALRTAEDDERSRLSHGAASDLVIVNHHLLCADGAVRQSGFAEVIPETDVLVIEARIKEVRVPARLLSVALTNFEGADTATQLNLFGAEESVFESERDRQRARAVDELRSARLRPEVVCEEIPAPNRVAPYSAAVSAAIALSERRRFDEVWLRNTGDLVGYDLVASALALGIAWLYMRSGVVGIAFVVLPVLFLRHTYLVNVQLQATNRELLDLMVKAIEARDPYTSGHSQRVSEMARALAREMGLHLKEVDNIATAALLHDVGKIYEEFAPILRKEGKLTPEERQIMHSHPVRSAELVGTISNLRGYVHRCVRHHHENFDGSGYPDGLLGDEIPIGARIILVADTTDAMTTDRPYRKALTYERVIEELDKFAGRQFDSRVVTAFKRSATVRRLVAVVRQPDAVPAFRLGERREQLAAR